MEDTGEEPLLRYFLATLGALFVLITAQVLAARAFPQLGGVCGKTVLTPALGLFAALPAAFRMGFSFSAAPAYLRGLRAEFGRALRYFVLMMLALYFVERLYDAALALWGSPLSEKLLHWNDGSKHPLAGDSGVASMLSNPLRLAGVLLTACAAAPLAEEFLFRRLFYRWLRRGLPVWAAVLASSALFGAAHGADFAATGFIGAGICLAYERTGRLETAILMHSFKNLLALCWLLGERLLY